MIENRDHSSGEAERSPTFLEDMADTVMEKPLRQTLAEHHDRRRRGTRAAMDWSAHGRTYLFVPPLLGLAALSALDLIGSDSPWQQAAGGAVLAATSVAMVVLLRWLLRPVDPESMAARQERRAKSGS